MSLINFSKIKEMFLEVGVNVADNYYTHRNYFKFPIQHLPYSHEGFEKYNEIIKFLRETLELNENKALFTKSGGVCTYRDGYGIKRYKTGYEIVVKYGPLCVRIIFDQFNKNGDKTEVGGRMSYLELNKEFKKDGIDLAKYAVNNGLEVKQTITTPLIACGAKLKLNNEYEHVHHLDFHSAYASGISETYPELKPTYERLYAKRLESAEQKKRIKSLFTNSTGYFQSQFCKIKGNEYALSPLAKAAIGWTKTQVSLMANELAKHGYTPLLFNTDGIWYAKFKGDKTIESKPYVNDKHGKTLGTYDNDHTECKFRVKSKGCYEFIENGEYHPVVRGVPREITKSWQWGDIYKRTTLKTYEEDENNYLKEKQYVI